MPAAGSLTTASGCRHMRRGHERLPLGTAGDDGAGIALALDAGGKTDKMGNVAA